MSGWRVARSLEVLRAEINAVAPGRSTASDGSIGDAAHADKPSDHNPNQNSVVCARDFTHDPGSGADMHRIARTIVATSPPALKYVIWDRQIWSRSRSAEGWRRYSGSNPHTQHMHVSVGIGPDGQSSGPYDDTTPWGVATGAPAGTGDDVIGLRIGDGMGARAHLSEQVKGLQALLQYAGFDPGEVDGKYGAATSRAVLAARRSVGSSITDGDNLTGWAWAQIMLALTRKEGTGKPGPPGPPGKDGILTLPKQVSLTGQITEIS